jgi:ribosomal protein S27AE
VTPPAPEVALEQPASCPQCGNPNLARYGNAVTCGACQWTNALTIEHRPAPPARPTLGRLRAWLLRLSIKYFEQISLRTKCPGCGHRRLHDIRFVATIGRVAHCCSVCKAEWTEAPIVQAADWAVRQRPDPPAATA